MTTQAIKTNYSKYIKDNDLMSVFLVCAQRGQQWNKEKEKCDVCFCTKAVNAKRVAWLEKGKQVLGKPEKVKIEPHLMNNMCGQNSQFLKEEFGWEEVTGYNITACPCGNMMTLEIHSLNRDENGKLRDWTKDFDKLQEKWFVPLVNQSFSSREITGRFPQFEFFLVGKQKCKCNVDWGKIERVNEVGNTAELKEQLEELAVGIEQYKILECLINLKL